MVRRMGGALFVFANLALVVSAMSGCRLDFDAWCFDERCGAGAGGMGGAPAATTSMSASGSISEAGTSTGDVSSSGATTGVAGSTGSCALAELGPCSKDQEVDFGATQNVAPPGADNGAAPYVPDDQTSNTEIWLDTGQGQLSFRRESNHGPDMGAYIYGSFDASSFDLRSDLDGCQVTTRLASIDPSVEAVMAMQDQTHFGFLGVTVRNGTYHGFGILDFDDGVAWAPTDQVRFRGDTTTLYAERKPDGGCWETLAQSARSAIVPAFENATPILGITDAGTAFQTGNMCSFDYVK